MSANAINPPVVVGIDGSETAAAATRWAAVDAVHHRAPLHIVYGIAAPVDFGPNIAFREIDYGVDGSPTSVHAIEVAFDEAAHRDVAVRAVLTWSEFNRYISRADMQKEAEELLSESLAGYAQKYPDLEVQRVVVEDRPTRRLLDESEKAQLIVVGSHGRGGFAGMTLGSVSQAILHATDCPLIIARAQS
ncbi:universal stress protein [Nocardia sp. CA-084685]|uniref:universal stress protein n=1 Tax=Nocardia sp. CA-084685 TaxID=3239970 RepID=UPI003D98FCE5